MLNQKYGVVYTPVSLAEFVAALLYRFSDIDEDKQALVLDPASGEGSLLRATKNLFGEYNRYVGIHSIFAVPADVASVLSGIPSEDCKDGIFRSNRWKSQICI